MEVVLSCAIPGEYYDNSIVIVFEFILFHCRV